MSSDLISMAGGKGSEATTATMFRRNKMEVLSFPLAEALFVTIDASEHRIMMPGISLQRKSKYPIRQVCLTHTSKSIFLAAPCLY
uniref:Uncharacterized protein n=1 Tax=Utricularia reniformis TaxID=192314 RepID=A0A1Y0B2M7_9LAMI|nr:hypothetical protein AEK19_MT1457 [Utricularia reniformis]ART31648.1 hypothetical protein AEK19_MT1457 [Utricularia reniformis]